MNAIAPLKIWTAPVTLGGLIILGLAGALLGDGYWDVLACLLIAGALTYAAMRASRRYR